MGKDVYIKPRHNFIAALLRPPVRLVLRFLYNYRGQHYKLEKGEQYLILANHQSVMDPPMVCLSFNRHLFIVATDTLFKNSFRSALLFWAFAPIAKRKGTTDISSIKTMKKVASEGGNLMIFPEGNRAWADYQFAISPAISKLVRMVGLPVMLYNFKGGYGVNPRWGRRLRRGRMTGEVNRILNLDEINSMNNDELHSAIVEGLKVVDSDSGAKFRSNHRAECLERELFICPACMGVSTIYSEGNYVRCKCGASAEYTEDLHLLSEDGSIPFTRLVEWYKFQLYLINEYDTEKSRASGGKIFGSDDVIFSDEGVTVYDQSGKNGKVKLGKGTLILTKKNLVLAGGKFSKAGKASPTFKDKDAAIDNNANAGKNKYIDEDCIEIPLKDITYKSVIGGVKLLIGTEKVSYFMVGRERFNPVKYALVLNRMGTACTEDIYYGTSL